MCLLEFCQFCVIGWCGWGLWIITFDGIFNFLVWWTIAIEGDIFCFCPFRAIMREARYYSTTQGVTLGLRGGFPFRESTVLTHNSIIQQPLFCSTLYTTNSKFIWGCCVTPIEEFYSFPLFCGYNVGWCFIVLFPRVLLWAYEADYLSGNLLCFCASFLH